MSQLDLFFDLVSSPVASTWPLNASSCAQTLCVSKRLHWGQRNLKHRLTSKRKMSAFKYFGVQFKKKKQQTKIHRFLKGNPLLRSYRVLQVEQNEKIIITIIQFSISGRSCVNVSSPQTAGPRHFSRNPLMYLILGHTRPWKSGRVHFF